MDDSSNVTDSTDWLQTPTPQVSRIEAALRCQVCKDLYNTPMITSCSHTFCSLCIRRCLTNDGICPVCRTPDQEVRLRKNWNVAELVDAFQVARPALIQFGKDLQATTLEVSQEKSKRKFYESHSDESGQGDKHCIPRRKTRSQNETSGKSRRLKQINSAEVEEPACEYQPGLYPVSISCHANKYAKLSAEDGLTPCPICNQRMKEEEVFTHLDVHNTPDVTSGGKSSISR